MSSDEQNGAAEPDEPTAEKPKADEPTAEKPPAETPTAETPPADEPTAEKPKADEPTAETPPADEPTAEKPTADEPKAAAQPRQVTRAGLPRHLAHAGAWLALLVVHALVITGAAPWPAGGARVRLAHHFYDAGYLCAGGLLSAGIVAAYDRWKPKARAAGWLGLGLLALVVGVLVLPDDLRNLSRSLLVRGSPQPALMVLVTVASMLPLAASWAGGWLQRRALRIALCACALAGAAANHFVVQRNYPGLHLVALWMAALAIAEAAAARPAVWQLPALGKRPRLALRIGQALAALVAAVSLVVAPSGRVWVELFRLPGTAFAPFHARLSALLGDRPYVSVEHDAWFVDRTHLPAIAPTHPPIVTPKGLIVAFITIDAIRSDLLEGEKYRAKLPTLHELRDRGVHFTQARTPSSATATSVSSFIAGRYFSGLHWVQPKDAKPKKGEEVKYFPQDDYSPRMSDVLADGGVPTVLIPGTGGFTNAFGVCRGFREEIRPGWSAAKLLGAAGKRLEKVGDGQLFFYAHLMEPHVPYTSGGKGETEFDSYVNEVAITDKAIGNFLKTVRKLGLEKRTVLIVSGDHGEAFGEHNTMYHGVTLYDEMVRVPLLVMVPGVAHRRVETPVSLIDVAPTVADLFGVPAPAMFLGQSLVPLLRGDDVKLERPLGLESGLHMRAMLFPDGLKAIYDERTGVAEIYDLEADPGELNNLYDPDDPAMRERVGKVRSFFLAHMHPAYQAGEELPLRP